MACYHPQTVYRSLEGRNKVTGGWPIVFDKTKGYQDLKLEIPCGKCIGCRLEKSRQWAIRCVHEAKMHEENAFLTLTYNDENVPDSLNKDDIQKFIKRLRKFIKKEKGVRIKYLQCGEYGENFERPHHHVCLFGYDFEDKQLFTYNNGIKVYMSDMLEKIWKKGFCTIGELNFESAAYVARYATKKITGEKAEKYYKGRKPEFITMSKKPPIGKEFIDKYGVNIYDNDRVIVNNKVVQPPRAYDKMFEKYHATSMDDIKSKRRIRQRKAKKDNYQERLDVKEEIKNIKFRKIERSYENGKF